MNNALILPVLIPLLTGALLLLFRPLKKDRKWVNAVSVTVLFASVLYVGRLVSRQGISVLRLGGWEPPFGIVFAVDWLSLFMLFFLNLVGLSVVYYSLFKEKNGRFESPYFDALVMFQLAGVNGALCTGDVFNLFVWYEVMLISSYALLAQGGSRKKMKGVPDYVVMNILSSTLFLIAVGITYASFGTLNMAHIGQLVEAGHAPEWITPLAMLFFVVFGTKSAVFPLYFWLFRGYPLASNTVAALLGGLLTKVGVYSILRVFTVMFPGEFIGAGVTFTQGLFYLVGAASIAFGLAGALSRHEWRDILSHHITSQIGYMIVGIGLWTTNAIAATIYYLIQNTVLKSGLFLIGGMTEDYMGTTNLEKQGGLIGNIPWVAGLFLLAGLGLAGVPPLSGFFAKMSLFFAAFELGGGWAYFVAVIGLGGGLFTLYSMVKIWRLSFLGEVDETRDGSVHPGLFIGPGLLVAASVMLGVFVGPVFHYSQKAADQLLNPDRYITAVLGDSPVYQLEPGEYEPEPVPEEGTDGGHH